MLLLEAQLGPWGGCAMLGHMGDVVPWLHSDPSTAGDTRRALPCLHHMPCSHQPFPLSRCLYDTFCRYLLVVRRHRKHTQKKSLTEELTLLKEIVTNHISAHKSVLSQNPPLCDF